GAGTDAPWALGTNWSCGHVPDSDDLAIVTGGRIPLVPAAGGQAGTLVLDTNARIDLASTATLAVTGSATFGAAGLSGAGTVGAGSFSKSPSAQLTLDNGVTLVPQNDVTWAAGPICVQNGSTFTVSHELDIQAAASGFNCNGGSGLVKVTATGDIVYGGGTHTWFTQLDVDGLLDLEGGSLTLSSTGANTDAGAVSIAASAQLSLSGSRTFAA